MRFIPGARRRTCLSLSLSRVLSLGWLLQLFSGNRATVARLASFYILSFCLAQLLLERLGYFFSVGSSLLLLARAQFSVQSLVRELLVFLLGLFLFILDAELSAP